MDLDDVGFVIIGRNEGERLRRCLTSVPGTGVRVYVDSGSTDGSQDFARSLGFVVLDLDRSQEFTAARARNLGIFYIRDHHPSIQFIHTVDGDCELIAGWVGQARQTLTADDRLAVVFGRRRERFPARNVHHIACEIEWDVPEGEAASCGGDALFRLSALAAVRGFNPGLIAGEEPDLCLRLRLAGWRIWADGRDMTLHDVAIDHFNQSWRRAMRAGHGIAELAAIHGRSGNPQWRRFLASAFFWTAMMLSAAFLLAASAVLTSVAIFAVGVTLAALLSIQVVRTSRQARKKEYSWKASLEWSLLLFATKIAQVQGAFLYWRRRLTASRRTLIEYKTA